MLFASDRTGAVSGWILEVAGGKPQGSARLLKSDIGRVLPLGITQKGAFYYALNNGFRDLFTAAFDFASGKLLESPKPVTERFTGANLAPAWSSDGKYLAYLSVRHRPQGSPLGGDADTIVIRSLETGGEREMLWKLKGWGMNAHPGLLWSPDGRSFLVHTVTKDNRTGEDFRIDAQTGEPSMLFGTEPVGGHFFHCVTPDGKSLVYALADGKAVKIVIRDLENGQAREVVSLYYDISGLTLSPDGRQIAFITQAGRGEVAALKVVPVTGGEPRALYRLKESAYFAWETLAWSRDGGHIVFGTGGMVPSQPTVKLWEIAVEGGEPRKLDLTMEMIRQLRTHPDGQHIAFESGRLSYEVGVMENFLPVMRAAK
jgi:dipeptidyl aminopeptidase/acylaminoacyl peptidase